MENYLIKDITVVNEGRSFLTTCLFAMDELKSFNLPLLLLTR